MARGDGIGSGADDAVRELDARLMALYSNLYDGVSLLSPARPHISFHIRNRLKRLHAAYVPLKQDPDAPLYGWVRQRVDDIPDFIRSFDPLPGDWRWVTKAGGVASFTVTAASWLLPVVGVPFAVTGLSAVGISIVNACFCKLWMIGLLSIFFAVLIYVIVGFSSKRTLMLGSDGPDRKAVDQPRPNAYALEAKLFRALGRAPSREMQLDVIGWFGLAAFMLGVFHLATWLEGFEGFRWSFDWPWWRHPYLFAGLLALLGVATWRESRDRKWAWRDHGAESDPAAIGTP